MLARWASEFRLGWCELRPSAAMCSRLKLANTISDPAGPEFVPLYMARGLLYLTHSGV
jgi:hypothetical protein